MGRFVSMPEYHLNIYFNKTKNVLKINVEGQDGVYTACYADLSHTGTYSEAINNLHDNIMEILATEYAKAKALKVPVKEPV